MTGAGKIIICPTPLGNLGDMPPRALDALRSCDVVCAEDTRVTGRLLAAFDIAKPLERMDEATLGARVDEVLDRVRGGETIAYCSDAGMPGVSDPGQRLVDAALDADVAVEVLPGPTAVATAYVASGFPCPRFLFNGFFPRKEGERTRALEEIASLDAVVLFYESPHRLVAALAVIAQMFPARRVAVCRELTKLHEEVCRGTAEELAAIFADREASAPIKGEIVIVLDAPSETERADKAADALEAARLRAAHLLDEQGVSRKDAVKILREEFGIARNVAYELVHGR